MNPSQPNPHGRFMDAWDRQRSENMDNAGRREDDLREEHDRLSALTWSDEDKKPRRDDP